MSSQELKNEVRALGYMAAVLVSQAATDPVCCDCKKIPAAHEKLTAHLGGLKGNSGLDEAELARLAAIGAALGAMKMPSDPKPQRKVGACILPDKACLIKHSRNMYKHILGIEEKGDASHGG